MLVVNTQFWCEILQKYHQNLSTAGRKRELVEQINQPNNKIFCLLSILLLFFATLLFILKYTFVYLVISVKVSYFQIIKQLDLKYANCKLIQILKRNSCNFFFSSLYLLQLEPKFKNCIILFYMFFNSNQNKFHFNWLYFQFFRLW
jgi:hypothetical protein